MAYQMAATTMTLNDLEGHSPVAGLLKCNPLNICAAFYTISTGSVLALFLCISRIYCFLLYYECNIIYHYGTDFTATGCSVFLLLTTAKNNEKLEYFCGKKCTIK